MAVILLELFSGIGGFAEGFKQAGITIDKHYFSEVDKYAIANYQYNYDKATYIGSVKHVRHIIRTINQHREPTDQLIITFGSPCQDFSLAGKRAGLAGAKSSLLHFALFLIKWLEPDLYIWENVKGAYSSNNGADFWAIIKAFTNIGGYTIEWQLLNTAWFLPQNRERIYLVGHFGGRSKPGIFPIGESQEYDSETSGKGAFLDKNSQVAATLKTRDYKGGTNFIDQMAIISYTRDAAGKITNHHTKHEANTIHSGTGGGGNTDQYVSIGAQRGRSYKGQPQQLEVRHDGLSNTLSSVNKDNYVVIQANTKQGYDIATNGDSINLKNFKSTTRRGTVGKQTAQTIDTTSNQAVVVPSTEPQTNIRRLTEIECERLQGFADDWTKFGNFDGTIKQISATQRYKMLGNAVTVAVVKAVASKIQFIK